MNEQPITAPAILNLTDIHKHVKDDIEERHSKGLKKLRSEFKAWAARAHAISQAAADEQEARLIEKWEAGDIAPEMITAYPTRESLARRLHVAGLRVESYHNYLEKSAAPILADLLDSVADRISKDILPEAEKLDASAKGFGAEGTVVMRVMESIRRHRDEAAGLRAGKHGLALSRLADFLPDLD